MPELGSDSAIRRCRLNVRFTGRRTLLVRVNTASRWDARPPTALSLPFSLRGDFGTSTRGSSNQLRLHVSDRSRKRDRWRVGSGTSGTGNAARRCIKVVSLARISPSPSLSRGATADVDFVTGPSDHGWASAAINLDKVAMTLEGRTTEDPYAVVAPILLLVRVGRMSKQYRTLSEFHVAPAVTNSREDFQLQGDAHAKRTNSAPPDVDPGAFVQIVDSPTTIDPRSTQCPAIRRPSALRCPLQCDRQPLDRCSANTRTRAPGLARSLRP
jgi:hypothetical protein